MKKIFTLTLLAVGLLFAAPANAQVKFGLKGGLNVSDIHFSDVEENFDKKNRAGWFIGPTIKITVPVTGLSFDASALYDYKSNKINSDINQNLEQETTIKQQSIIVPVNVRYGVGLSSLANIFLFAGPQWAFNVGDRNFDWQTATDSHTYRLRNSTFSINVGAGVTVLKHLQLTADYNIAVGKTADVTVWDAAESVAKSVGKGRNNSWQIALAYYF